MERSRRRRLRGLSLRWAVFLAAVLAAGAFAHTARASTLAGEAFSSDVDTVNCGPTSFSPFTYHVEGVASAPHAGTFVEDGEVVLNEIGQLDSLDATFTIISAGGNVTGEKHFVGPPGATTDFGHCGESTVGPFAQINSISGRICYRAEFADGSTEFGVSFLTLMHFFDRPISQFSERFFPDPLRTSCGAACPPNDDEDGDGLTNNNERAFFTLLGNDDSDFDGTADGNDDANGNGEDDEDEDDDEDDGCPDEDSDDDGEDDEDEDDDEDDD